MTQPDTLRRLLDALDYAARAHTGQTRKGAAGEPYVNHVIDVVARLARSPRADADTLVAAALHDVVEDTERTLEDVRSRFGEAVATVVAEVTDDTSLPKEERKRRQVEEAPKKSEAARRIKLADKASNLAALAESPPHWWDKGRKQAYLQWARDVVAGLRGVDPALEVAFDEEATRAEAALD